MVEQENKSYTVNPEDGSPAYTVVPGTEEQVGYVIPGLIIVDDEVDQHVAAEYDATSMTSRQHLKIVQLSRENMLHELDVLEGEIQVIKAVCAQEAESNLRGYMLNLPVNVQEDWDFILEYYQSNMEFQDYEAVQKANVVDPAFRHVTEVHNHASSINDTLEQYGLAEWAAQPAKAQEQPYVSDEQQVVDQPIPVTEEYVPVQQVAAKPTEQPAFDTTPLG